VHAQFSAGRQRGLRERGTALMLRDEEGGGAPPRGGADLLHGTAVLPAGGGRGGAGPKE
jgi:hypothetical protein